VTVDLIARAQRAQKISDVHPGGYPSLNALVVGAVAHECDVILGQGYEGWSKRIIARVEQSDAPGYTNWPQFKKRSFVFPVELLARAKRAQRLCSIWQYGYQTLDAFFVGAIKNEIATIAAQFNNGQPIEPFDGNYRTGRPTQAGRPTTKKEK